MTKFRARLAQAKPTFGIAVVGKTDKTYRRTGVNARFCGALVSICGYCFWRRLSVCLCMFVYLCLKNYSSEIDATS